MSSEDKYFRELIVPHFEAAFSLARWLTGTEAEAADVLQEAALKAFRFLDSQELENPKAWFLKITRNTAYTMMKARRSYVEFDWDRDGASRDLEDPSPSAEDQMVEEASAKELHAALNELPTAFREILILRELDELSYEEVSEVLQVPIGTAMSRISRARALLKKKLLSKGDLK